jgi:hemoglobin
MIVEYARYKIDEPRRAAFEKDCAEAAKSLKASRHCLGYELSQCTEDAGWYILRMEWDSEEGHLKGFRRSPEFQEFFKHVKAYVKDMEEMRHYAVTPTVARK